MSDSLVEVAAEPKKEELVIHKPACTSYYEFEEWMLYARRAPPPEDTGFCTDCTPVFQTFSRMRGTCSRPDIKFRRDEEENVWEAYKA